MQVVQELAGYITLDKASKELDVTYMQLNHFIRKGDIPVIKIGHTRLISRSEVEKLRKKP